MHLRGGRLVHIPSLQLFTFRDDLIDKHHVQFDMLHLVKQLTSG
jgi:hypothetical protein